jgi:hypothetical protein
MFTRLAKGVQSRLLRAFSKSLDGFTRHDLVNNAMAASSINQKLLMASYQQLGRSGGPYPKLVDTEFRCYSQNGEDGILLYLFSQIGFSSRRVVELCAAHGMECNAANLLIHHGFEGLLFDGGVRNVDLGRKFYAHNRNTFTHPPAFVQAWITRDNVNGLIAEHGFRGDVDLLSLDVDGNDYWILEAIDVISPRVIVLEFNYELGPTASYTIAYDPAFVVDFSDPPLICSASLAAFTKLLATRDYRLVGVHSLGFNAFFVRNDVATDALHEQTPESCFADTPKLQDWTSDRLERMLARSSRWQEV